MGMGTGISFFKIILYFAVFLFILSVMLLPLLHANSPEFVITVVSLVVDVAVALGAWIYIWKQMRAQKQRK